MGYSVSSIDAYGEELAYYHYPQSDKDRPLHKVLGMGYIKNQNRIEKVYSLGDLLEAKSKLMNITGSIGEQDFIDATLLAMKETNAKKILIIFN